MMHSAQQPAKAARTLVFTTLALTMIGVNYVYDLVAPVAELLSLAKRE